MTYIVHGATGAQGAPVVAALAASGKAVAALTRNPTADVPGASVVVADAASAEALTHAYRDADGVFVHLPVAAEDDRRVHARNVVAAVDAARPAHVVVSTSGFAIDTPGSDGDGNGDDQASAMATLVGGLAGTGVPHAVIAPELYLENLLMPQIIEAVREHGVLRYPLPAGFPVSWASHLDIADVASVLFDRPDVAGVVTVGQLPAIDGADLAAAFGAHFGIDVIYEAMTPDEFRVSLAPLIGEGPAAGIADSYRAMAALPDRAIDPGRSAQTVLGIAPRTPTRWLKDIGVRSRQ